MRRFSPPQEHARDYEFEYELAKDLPQYHLGRPKYITTELSKIGPAVGKVYNTHPTSKHPLEQIKEIDG